MMDLTAALDKGLPGIGAIIRYMMGDCTLKELARHLTWIVEQMETTEEKDNV